MLVIRSKNGVPIRLTEERWGHVGRRHPEMSDQKDRVLETVAELMMSATGRHSRTTALLPLIHLADKAYFG